MFGPRKLYDTLSVPISLYDMDFVCVIVSVPSEINPLDGNTCVIENAVLH